ncbi:phosphatase PAP2 family protein [Herminiimonas fonticola]|uniref:Undecaprenyl-diphosphatase n=1 Tax=Herminiimonas fonticola TaxID=303380 RepID=A0A4R6G652_9BURK|nr:phosphatase PAP2 family protein [Herminiimonas fonticola]RBA23957.1 PAP2 superfamily [Herminiimonas fonticola]TDN89957.1 undecaprenyl-diphosphatase [Herminiimonas fonticola]
MTNPVRNYFTKQDGWTLRSLRGNHAYIGQIRKALLLFGVILPMIFFFSLAERINRGGFPVFEKTLLWSLRVYATPLLDHIASTISMLVTLLSVFILCYLLYQRLWRTALFWLVAIAGSAILASILKIAIQRSRPDLWITHASFGFPSGHATQSMAIAIALVILWRSSRKIPIIVAISIAAVLLVGVCRMYQGFHYPSDILAGWMLSLAWVSALALLFNTRYLIPYKTSMPPTLPA